MEMKTKIDAQDASQELTIIRDFELPVELLFRAYVEADIVEQWMGTKVLKLDARKHGSYHFETTDPRGNKYQFSGAIHNVVQDKKIIRTFEMEGVGLGVQLEVYEFEATGDECSRLTMHVIYESAALRDQQLKMPFAQGINMAHNRIQDILSKLK